MNCEGAPERILDPVLARTHEKMLNHPGVVLTVHDTTELDYSGSCIRSTTLGQSAMATRRGLLARNSLAVTPSGEFSDWRDNGCIAGATFLREKPRPKARIRRIAKVGSGRMLVSGCLCCPRDVVGWTCAIAAPISQNFSLLSSVPDVVTSCVPSSIGGWKWCSPTGKCSSPSCTILCGLKRLAARRDGRCPSPHRPGWRRRAELAVAWCSLTILPRRVKPRGDHDQTAARRRGRPCLGAEDPPAGSKPWNGSC